MGSSQTFEQRRVGKGAEEGPHSRSLNSLSSSRSLPFWRRCFFLLCRKRNIRQEILNAATTFVSYPWQFSFTFLCTSRFLRMLIHQPIRYSANGGMCWKFPSYIFTKQTTLRNL